MCMCVLCLMVRLSSSFSRHLYSSREQQGVFWPMNKHLLYVLLGVVARSFCNSNQFSYTNLGDSNLSIETDAVLGSGYSSVCFINANIFVYGNKKVIYIG